METSHHRSSWLLPLSWFAVLPPFLLTGLRFMAALLLVMNNAGVAWRLPIFFFACLTDLLDGAVARLLSSETRVGALMDASADFALVVTVSLILTREGLLSTLFVYLIVFSFAQFVVAKPRVGSDRLGKHIGTVLFVALFVALAMPVGWVVWWCSLMASGYILASLVDSWLIATRLAP
jgi:CDP-diacylglycerol--glycerol-3-phosphate 3-phosphatidyltransferase